MRPKKVLITWVQKLVYGWLIFWVGGLAPLTFSTPLSPHRDIPTVIIALFDSPRHFSFAPASSGPIASSLKWVWRTQSFNPNSKFHSFESFIPSLVQLFQSNMSSGYLLTVARAYLIPPTSLFGLIALYILTGRSALLPPIEKPPQSLVA
ncbi:MAG: hypothetical protein DPW09_15015 [Anaerolineae bacterium]|nr:hypothetical protein [Anaerolineae bacterium]